MWPWWDSVEKVSKVNAWVLGLAAAFGFAAAFFVVAAWFTGARLSDLQDTELSRYKADSAAQVAEAGKQAGEANARAAEANRIAEQERLARAKIEESIAPRRISAKQEAALLSALQSLIGKEIAVFIIAGNPETDAFGNSLASILKKGGLKVGVSTGTLFGSTSTPPGLSLRAGDNRVKDAEILAQAFVLAGLATKPVPGQRSGNADELQIIVAPKL